MFMIIDKIFRIIASTIVGIIFISILFYALVVIFSLLLQLLFNCNSITSVLHPMFA